MLDGKAASNLDVDSAGRQRAKACAEDLNEIIEAGSISAADVASFAARKRALWSDRQGENASAPGCTRFRWGPAAQSEKAEETGSTRARVGQVIVPHHVA